MIFITGCTGLVGSHLVATLLYRQRSTDKGQQLIDESTFRVKLLCRKNSDLSLLKDVLQRYGFNEVPSNIEFVYGDVLDYDILE